MLVTDAIQKAQLVGGLYLPKTETHFVEMMAPTAKRHMVVDGKVAYQGHKWTDALERIPADRRDTYVDIGAHAGLWAWFLSKRFSKTLAFEAAPLHAALFRANLAVDWEQGGASGINDSVDYYTAQNGEHGLVQLYEVALGNEHGTCSIECAADETGSAHVAQKGGGDKRRGHGELITYSDIPMFKLDDFKAPGRVDFVKIDVEGFELPVIQGGQKFFMEHKPWIVVEQKDNDTIYGDPRHAASSQLGKWGWKSVKVISGDNLMSPPE